MEKIWIRESVSLSIPADCMVMDSSGHLTNLLEEAKALTEPHLKETEMIRRLEYAQGILKEEPKLVNKAWDDVSISRATWNIAFGPNSKGIPCVTSVNISQVVNEGPTEFLNDLICSLCGLSDLSPLLVSDDPLATIPLWPHSNILMCRGSDPFRRVVSRHSSFQSVPRWFSDPEFSKPTVSFDDIGALCYTESSILESSVSTAEAGSRALSTLESGALEKSMFVRCKNLATDTGTVDIYLGNRLTTIGLCPSPNQMTSEMMQPREGVRVAASVSTTLTCLGEWTKEGVLDLVTNHEDLAHIMSASEVSRPACRLKQGTLLRGFIALGTADRLVRLVLRMTAKKTQARVSIEGIRSSGDLYLTLSILEGFCKLYSKTYSQSMSDPDREMQEWRVLDPREKVLELRRLAPDLFTNNYTRESAHIPRITDSPELVEWLHSHNVPVIQYPEQGFWYYSDEPGKYPGLKRNRTSSNRTYPFIVNCYSKNHLERHSSLTYKYFFGSLEGSPTGISNKGYETLRQLPKGRFGTMPLGLLPIRCRRVGCESFVDALEECISDSIDREATCPILCRQEFPLWSEERLHAEISAGTCNDLYFRCFEELLGINILVLIIRNGSYIGYEAPKVHPPYLRSLRFDSGVVLFRNELIVYGQTSVVYEALVRGSRGGILRMSLLEPIVKEIVNKVAPCSYPDHGKYQVLNPDGRCCFVLSTEQEKDATLCFCAPLQLPVVTISWEQTFPDHFEGMLLSPKTICSSDRIYIPNSQLLKKFLTRFETSKSH